MSKRIVVIAGPTASGKTELSLALAERLNGEIVSADSMQIYRGMDIGTAKPTIGERRGIPHHMLDVAEPGDDWSVSRYEQQASNCVDDILRRGRLPILCGGTGLYINAVISGAGFQASGADSGVRAALEKQWDAQGADAMCARLRAVDPESAARLHPNDRRRIIRALEVYELTGETISEHNRRTRERPPRYDAVMLGLKTDPRDVLYQRIDRRVGKMVEQGLIEEVRSLWQRGVLKGTAAQAIGYKELIDYFESRKTLDEALRAIQQKSRNYAKRQLTWFQADDRIHWIVYNTVEAADQVTEKATIFLQQAGLK
ncbi:MAG TPA: tRNA (adenosine(37)-N6)-dimethylallyltransferase MiaA [Candidatus Ventrousia excrementavium]|uniref:tRNA dimethylallyltransferase n=1 Tax=Candidatus Ventrousia excrementavium TaxID=2840961 RepID=A0A9D1S221_9CLOT|nr:tRNA (adenosine(37)-N6)-dimethylallyltransferase MiaA [Candidatus Ventrousia excrementavium]